MRLCCRDVTAGEIAQRAFVIYQQRGAANGSDLDDWLDFKSACLTCNCTDILRVFGNNQLPV